MSEEEAHNTAAVDNQSPNEVHDTAAVDDGTALPSIPEDQVQNSDYNANGMAALEQQLQQLHSIAINAAAAAASATTTAAAAITTTPAVIATTTVAAATTVAASRDSVTCSSHSISISHNRANAATAIPEDFACAIRKTVHKDGSRLKSSNEEPITY